MSYQATDEEQVSKESVRLASLISTVSRAMAEQASASSQIATAADSLRQQTDQASRAMVEQSTAMKDLTVGSQNITKQIGLITRANLEQSRKGEEAVAALSRSRVLVEENGADARSLIAITDGLLESPRSSRRRNGADPGRSPSNGRGVPRPLVRNGRP